MKPIKLLVSLSLSLISVCGIAQTQSMIAVVPTAWRLQNYMPDVVAIWFSGSTCTNGQLLLPANATAADRNRLWATVTAGKTTNKKVFVYYTVSGATCSIDSFGLLEE